MFELKINGATHQVDVSEDTPLLYVLNGEIGLKGPRFGCGLAQCGSCSVLLDGVEIRSCVIPASALAGKEITTLEGLPVWYAQRRGMNPAPELYPLQQAIIDEQALQCDYCCNGMTVKGPHRGKSHGPVRVYAVHARTGHAARPAGTAPGTGAVRQGGARARGDESSIADIPDARVVRKGNFVGVVADKEWHAVKAARQLRVSWEGTPAPYSKPGPARVVNQANARAMYDIPHCLLNNHHISAHDGFLRGNPLRSPVDFAISFASEQAIDELALKMRMDPAEFRLRNISDPRWLGVLNAVLRASNWRPRPAQRARARGDKRIGRGVAVGARWVCGSISFQ